MRVFNSIQITVLFCLYPFVTQWVMNAGFYGQHVLFWILCVGYVFSFGGMAYAVHEALEAAR